MFSFDDRAGNVVTTVALFMLAMIIVYMARGAFLILLLSLLFAYLLEPAVAWVQEHSRLFRKNRTWAIAQVYLVGALVIGSLAYALGSHVVVQAKNLNATMPGILENLSSGNAGAGSSGARGLTAAQQLWMRDFLVSHRDSLARLFEHARRS